METKKETPKPITNREPSHPKIQMSFNEKDTTKHYQCFNYYQKKSLLRNDYQSTNIISLETNRA